MYTALKDRSLSCTGGYDYFTIGSEGHVYRCGALLYLRDGYLGNIFKDTLQIRATEFMDCPYGTCSRICDKNWCTQRVMEGSEITSVHDVLSRSHYEGKNRPVSIVWSPTWKCNYRCKYCKLPPECMTEYPSVPKLMRTMSSDAWVNAFSRFFDLNGIDGGLMQCCGGETMLYEGIEEVMEFVYKRGFALHVTTNLSRDMSGLKRISISSVRITASLHHTEPHFDWDVFKDKVVDLKNAGYAIAVNIVSHPDNIPLIPKYYDFLQQHGVNLCVVPMTGGWSGVEFNDIDDYPPHLRDILEKYVNPDHLVHITEVI